MGEHGNDDHSDAAAETCFADTGEPCAEAENNDFVDGTASPKKREPIWDSNYTPIFGVSQAILNFRHACCYIDVAPTGLAGLWVRFFYIDVTPTGLGYGGCPRFYTDDISTGLGKRGEVTNLASGGRAGEADCGKRRG